MRFLLSYALLVLGLVLGAQAQLPIADMPACGITCVVQTVPASGCSFTDNDCLCNNEKLRRSTANCVQQNCTMSQALTVARVQATICQLPDNNIGNILSIMAIVMDSFSALCVILRLVTRRYQVGKLGADDWLIALAVLTLAPLGYMSVQMVNEGFGQHIHQLVDGALLKILRYFWISTLLYVLDLGFIKMSLLFFYLRIFPGDRFRVVLWVSMAFVVLSTLLIVFLAAFQCTPVQFYWNKDIEGKCLNINAVAYGGAGVSIFSDILIVALPIPVIGHLHLGTMKKIGVAFMFAIGSFGCIISIIRLRSIVAYGQSVDPTYDLLLAVAWSCVEVNVAIVCACFPALRKLFALLVPRVFGTTKDGKSTFYANSSRPSRPDASKSWYAPGSVTTSSGNMTSSRNGGVAEEMELEGRGWSANQRDQRLAAEDDRVGLREKNSANIGVMEHGRGRIQSSRGTSMRRSNTLDSVNPLVSTEHSNEQDREASSDGRSDQLWQPSQEELSNSRRTSGRLSRLGLGWMGGDRARDERSPIGAGATRRTETPTTITTWYDSDSRYR